MKILIEEILKRAHRKVSKDIDYPVAGSEDLAVILDHVDDAISEWEDLTQEGYNWPELLTSGPFVFAGSGIDALPIDFLIFPSIFGDDGFERMSISIGNSSYQEVTSGEGEKMAQDGNSENVFWIVGDNIRTFPAASGTVTLPYLKQATRFPLGTETTPPEMRNPKFIEDFVTAKMFFDNSDDTMYQAYMTQAGEKLKGMKYKSLV